MDYSAGISTFTGCSERPASLPVQMAIGQRSNVEPSAGPRSATNAEAILGGQMSKLEQMQLAQAFGGSFGTSTAAEISSDIARTAPNACDPLYNRPSVPDTTTSIAIPADAILGSMPIAIARTPFDRKWSAANANRASAKVAQVLATTSARNSNNLAAQVEAVNRWVNRNIAFGEDRDIYGRADYWAPASETFRRGIGDCEDMAIAKMELLSALGIGRDKMRLVIARDLVRNADHAVLVVAMSDGPVMLDNMTDRLLDARLPNDYRPIMSFSQNTKWVHGYATQQPQPMRITLANPVPQPAKNRLIDVVAVTVEPEMPILSMVLLSVPLVLPNELSARA